MLLRATTASIRCSVAPDSCAPLASSMFDAPIAAIRGPAPYILPLALAFQPSILRLLHCQKKGHESPSYVRAFAAWSPFTMPSADFCKSFGSPLGDPSQ